MTVWKALGVCALYGATSCALGLLNKGLLSSHGFEGVFVLLSSQFACAITFGQVSKRWFGNPFGVPDLKVDSDKVLKALPLGCTYFLNVAVGLLALKATNVPMFNCLRRLVAPLILLWDLLQGRRAGWQAYASIGVVVLGSVCAAYERWSAEYLGYTLTLINNALTAANGIMQASYSREAKVSPFGIVYLTALIAGPLSLGAAVALGEVERALMFPGWQNPVFTCGFILSSFMGLLLTFSITLCTTYVSPIATSITGQLKDVGTTSLGWMLFGGFVATPLSLTGLVMAFVGSLWYSWQAFVAQRATDAAKTLAADMEAKVKAAEGNGGKLPAGVTVLAIAGGSGGSGDSGDSNIVASAVSGGSSRSVSSPASSTKAGSTVVVLASSGIDLEAGPSPRSTKGAAAL